MWKLGTMVKDKVTGLRGMLTHFHFEGSTEMYDFEPRGLNPKTQEPVEGFWLTPDRVMGGIEISRPYLAEEVLGTVVEDLASGFKGTAVSSILHINGCLHIDIQPAGVVKETGAKIKRHNFDLRRLKGKAIKPMSEKEIEASTAKAPSPAPFPRLRD